MAKLIVVVVDASDLMPKDGQGSANPFVEVDFDDEKQRTQTKMKDLNPSWNENLVFNIKNPSDLQNRTIEVSVYNDRKEGNPRNFLGRVRISGLSVPFSGSEASVNRYPLEKRGIFSHIKGDVALRIYAQSFEHHVLRSQQQESEEHVDVKINSSLESEDAPRKPPPLQELNTNKVHHHLLHDDEGEELKGSFHDIKKEKKTKEKEVRTFHSVGTHHTHSSSVGGGGTGGVGAPPPPSFVHHPPPPPQRPSMVEGMRMDFMKAPPATVMHMQMPGQRPEFGVVETRPPLAARMGYWGRDKTATTYDLVEPMHFLYVDVVKAKDLPVMDMSGSLDPYVEVKVGNYKGVTGHFEKNQYPVWNRVFAFSKERVQSNLIEITVKDKDVGKDDFVGKVLFDIVDVPTRVPPDSPLAPQWYRLANKKGEKLHHGEIMLAVWNGTQADESFPDAWHSDAHSVSQQTLANTRSKVYFSPKLYYLRVHIIEAQDLITHDRSRPPDAFVKIQLGHQGRVTRPSQIKTLNPMWNEELMFVASEPFDEYLIISVEDRVGPGRDEILGRQMIPVRNIPQRMDTMKLPDPIWLNLHKPSLGDEDGDKKKEAKFSSKIHVRLCLDAGYHVLDESTHFSSDLQPSAKVLRKHSIGILEVGILSAKNLLPMKGKDGRMTDSYCVAKYGNKWVRTRTLLDTLHPRWNEQYTWEVHDPCTVITVGVFDNCHINGHRDDARDQRIGKVRIRLSTLETDRIYTHYYPLLVLTPSGLRKHGELQLAIRFTCTAWVNMVAQYGRPLLPKMHYVQPISVRHIDWLRHQAMQIVSTRLVRAEPPLRREVVEYMLDVDYHMFSLRRSKANFFRIMSLLSGITAACRWFGAICYWKNPLTTILVHILFLILVCYPDLILPTIFLYLFVIGLWNYRFRPRNPPHMDARLSHAENVHPDELDEEFDTFPTSRPTEMVRMRYDRLRSVAGRVQAVVGDLATQGERALGILSWRDPRATAIVIIFSLIFAIVLYVTPFQILAVLMGMYWLRHPRFRSKLPSVPANFFKRLPAKTDMLL